MMKAKSKAGVLTLDGSVDLSQVDTNSMDWSACDDFGSCRDVAMKLRELEFSASQRMVQLYKPADEEGFADLIRFVSHLITDKKEVAAIFGVAVSTFYRWKSGDTIPHALVRASVKEAILEFLSRDADDGQDEPPVQRPARVARTVTH